MDNSIDKNKEILLYEEQLVLLYMSLKSDLDETIRQALDNKNNVAYLISQQKEVIKKLESYKPKFKKLIGNATNDIYKNAVKIVDKDLKDLKIDKSLKFGGLNEKALEILADNTYNDFNSAMQSIGRQANDNLRTLGLEVVKGTIGGYKTVNQVALGLEAQIKAKIGTTVKYKDGRNVKAYDYAKMVARTTTAQIHRTATQNRILQTFKGNDAIEIIGPKDEKNRPICHAEVGKLFSIGGLTKELPLLSEYIEAGGFGVNCRHDMGVTLKVIQYYKDNNIDY